MRNNKEKSLQANDSTLQTPSISRNEVKEQIFKGLEYLHRQYDFDKIDHLENLHTLFSETSLMPPENWEEIYISYTHLRGFIKKGFKFFSERKNELQVMSFSEDEIKEVLLEDFEHFYQFKINHLEVLHEMFSATSLQGLYDWEDIHISYTHIRKFLKDNFELMSNL